MFETVYFGLYTTSVWEILLGILLIFTSILLSYFYQNEKKVNNPEYKYYTYGLSLKLFGGVMFFLIYGYYYNGGDTSSYFQSSMSYAELFYSHPFEFLKVYFSAPTEEMTSLFFSTTGKPPLHYVVFDSKTLFVAKFFVPFAIITYNSYFLTTLLVSFLSFFMVWQLYKTFCKLTQNQFISFLVCFCIPSALIWASGISKDVFTYSATCWMIGELILYFSIQEKYERRAYKSFLVVLINLLIIIKVKPYIVIVIFPAFIMWRTYTVMSKYIKHKGLRFILYPIILVSAIMVSYGFLNLMGESLDKFQIDQALDQAVVIQQDLKQDYYGGQTFDIGDFDASLSGVLLKFPIATFAGLFYPLPYQVSSVVSFLSSLENLILLLMFLRLLIARQIRKKMGSLIRFNSTYLFLIIFVILFAFMIGLTTPNFGALVRFKVPIFPSFLLLLLMLNQSKKLMS